MNPYFLYRNRILLTALGSSIILAALVCGMGHLNSALSLLAGALVGMTNFFLLAREVNRFAPGPGFRNATKNLMLTSAFRYFVMFVGFAVCASKAWFVALPFCLGVFLVQIVIVANAFFIKEKGFVAS